MHFKLIIALVDDTKTDVIMDAARKAGATGATVLSQVRGEGIEEAKTFFGLNLESTRDMLMFLVEEHLARQILEFIAEMAASKRTRAPASPSSLTWKMPLACRDRYASSQMWWRKRYE